MISAYCQGTDIFGDVNIYIGIGQWFSAGGYFCPSWWHLAMSRDIFDDDHISGEGTCSWYLVGKGWTPHSAEAYPHNEESPCQCGGWETSEQGFILLGHLVQNGFKIDWNVFQLLLQVHLLTGHYPSNSEFTACRSWHIIGNQKPRHRN